MNKILFAFLMLFGNGLVSAANPPPPSTPPTPLTPEQQLGKQLFTDKNLSLNQNVACAMCHSLQVQTVGNQTAASFVDPKNVANATPVSGGSVIGDFGTLNAPMAGYAAYSPVFNFNISTGQYVGGQFWDGRAGDLQLQDRKSVV